MPKSHLDVWEVAEEGIYLSQQLHDRIRIPSQREIGPCAMTMTIRGSRKDGKGGKRLYALAGSSKVGPAPQSQISSSLLALKRQAREPRKQEAAAELDPLSDKTLQVELLR